MALRSSRKQLLLLGQAAAGGTAYTASLSETVTVSEALSSLAARKATGLAETVSLSDALTVRRPFTASVAETVSLAEVLASKAGAKTTPSETVTLVEQVSLQRAAYKATALAETVALTEVLSLARARFKALSLAETAALSEALSTSRAAFKATSLTETVALAETLSQKKASFKATALAETVALSEALSLVRFRAHPTLSEVLGLTESVLSSIVPGAVHYIASLAETVVLVEALAARWSTRASLAETASVAEALGSKASRVVQLQETATVAEVLASTAKAHVAAAEAWGDWLEQLAAHVGITVPALVEAVGLAEALAAGAAYRVSQGEIVTLAEALAEKANIFAPAAQVQHGPTALQVALAREAELLERTYDRVRTTSVIDYERLRRACRLLPGTEALLAELSKKR